MILINIKPSNVIAAVALLAPVAIVQTTRLLFGSGPERASAMSVGPSAQMPTDAPIGPVTAPLDARQKAAVDYLTRERAQIPEYISPFTSLKPRAVVVQQTYPPQQAEIPASSQGAQVPVEVRSLTLSAIMRNDSGPFALIGGKARTVGDVVVAGWTISEIDLESRTVTITSDDGATVYLTSN